MAFLSSERNTISVNPPSCRFLHWDMHPQEISGRKIHTIYDTGDLLKGSPAGIRRIGAFSAESQAPGPSGLMHQGQAI